MMMLVVQIKLIDKIYF